MLVRILPILGGLPSSRRSDFKEATKEVVVTLLLSLSPIWFGALIVLGVDQDLEKTVSAYGNVLLNSVKSGELFIYSTATLSPVFYVILRDWRETDGRPPGARDFPARMSNIVISALIIAVSFTFFGIHKAGVWLDITFIFPLSLILFLFSVLIYFVVKVYDNARMPDLAKMSKKQAEDFSDQLKRHRE